MQILLLVLLYVTIAVTSYAIGKGALVIKKPEKLTDEQKKRREKLEKLTIERLESEIAAQNQFLKY